MQHVKNYVKQGGGGEEPFKECLSLNAQFRGTSHTRRHLVLRLGHSTVVYLSCPASARLFSTLRLNLVTIHGIPPDFRGGVHLFIPPSEASPEFFGSRSDVPMAFTAESPPAQGQ